MTDALTIDGRKARELEPVLGYASRLLRRDGLHSAALDSLAEDVSRLARLAKLGAAGIAAPALVVEDVVTTAEAAAIIGVQRRAVTRRIERGELPARRDASGHYLVARSDAEAARKSRRRR